MGGVAEEKRRAADSLKTIYYRLSTTPKQQLPIVAPQAAVLLEACQALFSCPKDQLDSSAQAVALRYWTQLTTLVNGKSPEERWASVLLLRRTIELGDISYLDKLGVCVKGLLAILAKPDPLAMKKLCIVTLTRIFVLTHGSAALIREITTPNLPAFITACLRLSEVVDHVQLKQIILKSFNQLIPNHPNIFRTFVDKIRVLLAPLVPHIRSEGEKEASQNWSRSNPVQVADSARRVNALLASCVPKPNAATKWLEAVDAVVQEASRVAIRFFTAGGAEFKLHVPATNSDENARHQNPPDWLDMFEESRRLCDLLLLVKSYIATPTAAMVQFPASRILGLTKELLVVVVPSSSEAKRQSQSEAAVAVSKEDKQSFLTLLPYVHANALEVQEVLLLRFHHCCKPFIYPILYTTEWVFQHEHSHPRVRSKTYRVLQLLLEQAGPALPRDAVRVLRDMISSCCADLSIPDTPSANEHGIDIQSNNLTGSKKRSNNDRNTSTATTLRTPPEVYAAAHALLPSLLTNLRADYVPQPLRTAMDRVAVLTNHKAALHASVLNPPHWNRTGKPSSSVLPLLARASPLSPQVESLLRPRLPVISSNADTGGSDFNGDAEDDQSSILSSADEAEAEAEDEEAEQDNAKCLDLDPDHNSIHAAASIPAPAPVPESNHNGLKRPFNSDPGLESTTSQDLAGSMLASKRGRFDVDPDSSIHVEPATSAQVEKDAAPAPAPAPEFQTVQPTEEGSTATQPRTIINNTAKFEVESDSDSDGSFTMPRLRFDDESSSEDENGDGDGDGDTIAA